jgi:lysophospholipase L1-like esterase
MGNFGRDGKNFPGRRAGAWMRFPPPFYNAENNRIASGHVFAWVNGVTDEKDFIRRESRMQEIDVYHHPTPYVVFHGTPHARVTRTNHLQLNEPAINIHLNELGFRIERPLSLQKPHGEKRIFLLGSSTVFNGPSLQDSLSGQLERCFHNEGRTDVQVYNFGFVSSVSGQELSLLVHLLADYSPDGVVVYNGGNDVCLPAFYDPRPGYPYNFIAYETVMRRIRFEPEPGASRWRLHGNGLDYDLVALRTSCGYGSMEWENAIISTYIRNIEKMNRFCRGYGFRFSAFLEPMLFFKQPLAGKEADILATISRNNLNHYVERQYARLRSLLGYLQREAGDNVARFVDLSMIFSGYDRETYRDHRHVDHTGNRHIAERLYSHLHGFV